MTLIKKKIKNEQELKNYFASIRITLTKKTINIKIWKLRDSQV